MGNPQAVTSLVLTGMLVCILLAFVWVLFRYYRYKMLHEQKGGGGSSIVHSGELKKNIDFTNNRQNNRAEIVWPVTIKPNEGEPMTGTTKDISIGGSFIVCEKPLPMYNHFELTIDVPGQTPLVLLAEVIWSNAGVPEERVICRGMGIKFLQIQAEARASLSAIIAAYALMKNR